MIIENIPKRLNNSIRIAIFFLLFCVPYVLFAATVQRIIHVATAGTLPDLISESEKYTIEELTLTGELNGTDFRLLRDMAGNNYLGQITSGKLKVLDLTNAKVVAGGEKYLDTNYIHVNGGIAGGSFHYNISQNNEIPKAVFYGCYLRAIHFPNTVISIKERAFYYCSGLTSISIPNSVSSIGNYAFYYCSGLTSISIPNSVSSIGNYAFSGCSGLTSISIPNSVMSIGKFAFSGCSGLTSISIPNSVTSIGYGVFSGCSGLTSIKVESGNTTYDSHNDYNAIIRMSNNELIAGCKNTVIPNFVTSIGEYAFGGCHGLTSITIPNSVTSIGSNAFLGCRGLTSISIPNSVTCIGEWAFSGCSGLTSITIPNSVTSIGNYAFSWSGLTSISIPNSMTSIGNYAFHECNGLKDIISEIKTPFEINENVFSVYSTATLTVPNGTKSAYQSTAGWNKFTNIVEVSGGNTSTKRTIHVATAGTLPDLISESEKYTIEELTLTGELNGTDFRLLRDMAGQETEGKLTVLDFSGAKIISGGADYIDTSIWWGGGGLRYTVDYNDILPKNVFERCKFISVKIPNSVTGIGGSAFSGCTALTSITIPNSVTSIGGSAFYGCTGLTSITIPNSVTRIGDDAFAYCSSLTSITIPSSVTSINNFMFSRCSGLTSITIPNSVTSIGAGAFFFCSGLTSITIPNSVTSIGGSAFYKCI